jgi:hypothetical protein
MLYPKFESEHKIHCGTIIMLNLFTDQPPKHLLGYTSQNSFRMGDVPTPILLSYLPKSTNFLVISAVASFFSLQTLSAKALALSQSWESRASSLQTSPQSGASAPRMRVLSTPAGNTVKFS